MSASGDGDAVDAYPDTDGQYGDADNAYPDTDGQYGDADNAPDTDGQYGGDNAYPDTDGQYGGADNAYPDTDGQYGGAVDAYPDTDVQYDSVTAGPGPAVGPSVGPSASQPPPEPKLQPAPPPDPSRRWRPPDWSKRPVMHQPRLEAYEGGKMVRSMSLCGQISFLVGRHGGQVDIIVADPSVSRQHAVFINSSTATHLQDLESAQGTWYDEGGRTLNVPQLGVRLDGPKPTKLVEGCTIRFGTYARTVYRVVGLEPPKLSRWSQPHLYSCESCSYRMVVCGALHPSSRACSRSAIHLPHVSHVS